MALLAGVLLGDLKFYSLAGVLERSKERRDRLTNLEVDWTVFDLDDYVGFKGSIKGLEVVIASASSVCFKVVIVEVIIVDEAAIEDDSSVWFKGAGNSVGGLGGSPVILRGADTAFRVGLNDEAGEVGDDFVDLVDFGFPPSDDGGVDGIESGKMAHNLRTGEVDGE